MGKWSIFFAALGLAMVLEGLPYFVFPRAVRAYLASVQRLPDGALRGIGLALTAVGLIVAYVSTR